MADMKYKIGEKVVINPRLLMVKRHGEDGGGGSIPIGKDWFTEDMENSLKGTDRVVKINGFTEIGYTAVFPKDDGDYSITDDMILGHAFEWGEEIEVSNNKGWEKRIFVGHVAGCGGLYCTVDGTYEKTWKESGEVILSRWLHARPIQAESEKGLLEIAVKYDAKGLSPDEIADFMKRIEKMVEEFGITVSKLEKLNKG